VPSLAIAGFGSIAEHGHLPALHVLDCEIVAVADVTPERLERAAALLPGADLFLSPDALIASTKADILDICSPPGTHAGLMVAACRRGIPNIICEKPFVLSPENYARVAAARNASGTSILSVNNWMYSDLYRTVAGVLASGRIGDIRSVRLRTDRTGAARGDAGWSPQWRTDLIHAGGGIILDHGWHQLYLLLNWFAQPVLSVSACTRTANPLHAPVEDEATIDLQFPDGDGWLELRWTAEDRSNSGEITGTHGRIAIYDGGIVVHNDANIEEIRFAGRLTESSFHPGWFELMFQRAILDIGGGEATRSFAEAGLLVEIVTAAYRSAQMGGEKCPVSPNGGVPGLGTDQVHGSGRGAGATSK
jgi:predicted dehydrogenase